MTKPRVLVLDIETSPALVWTYSLYKPVIGIKQVVEPTRMISWAAGWAGERKTMFGAEWLTGPDFIADIHALWSEADALVGWNSDSFDLGHLRREFRELGLPVPPPVRRIDLMKHVKKDYTFLSNKLDWVSERLTGDNKIDVNMMTQYIRIIQGDEKAMRETERYNRKDVALTRDLYHMLEPELAQALNRGLFVGEDVACPKCGAGQDRLERRGYAYTQVSKFRRYVCRDCGSWSRTNVREGATKARHIA